MMVKSTNIIFCMMLLAYSWDGMVWPRSHHAAQCKGVTGRRKQSPSTKWTAHPIPPQTIPIPTPTPTPYSTPTMSPLSNEGSDREYLKLRNDNVLDVGTNLRKKSILMIFLTFR